MDQQSKKGPPTIYCGYSSKALWLRKGKSLLDNAATKFVTHCYPFVLRLSSIFPNRFLFVFFLFPFLLRCLLGFFLVFASAFIFFSFVAHLISFSFQKTFYPIITHTSSNGPKTPYVRCVVLANKVFPPSMIVPRMTKVAIPGRI